MQPSSQALVSPVGFATSRQVGCRRNRWAGAVGLLTCLLPLTMPVQAEIKMEQISYAGWPHCVRLSNAHVELVATTDVGPRIMRLGFVGGQNLFKEWPDQAGKTGGDEWRIYGGHRLWHAPEAKPRSYATDNAPVAWDWDGRRLKLSQPVESITGLQKELEIVVHPDTAAVTVLHRLINHNLWDVQAAPWAMSVCLGPGRAIVPQEPFIAHADKVLPARTMTLWGYTDMHDPRFRWGTKYVELRSDPAVLTSQKVGFLNTPGWAAFVKGGDVFLKRFAFDPKATYADFGCNTEIYTNGDMLELETLGPSGTLSPGASVEHVEQWHLFRANVGEGDSGIDQALLPLVLQTKAVTP